MEITQEPLIRSRWNFLRLLPCMFAFQWRRRHSVMRHLWRQPWWHRRHGKCRMTQTSTREGYGTVCVFLLSYFLPVYVFEVGKFNGAIVSTLPPPFDLENPVWTGNTGTSRLPIFFPGGILWYHLYLCFRGRGIQWWHVQNSTTTGWPQKSSSRNMGNLEVPVLPVRTGFSKSRDNDMNVKVCPLNSSASKT